MNITASEYFQSTGVLPIPHLHKYLTVSSNPFHPQIFKVLLLGTINNRQIFYVNVRKDNNWLNKIPTENWVAFTITNKEDKELVEEVINVCIDKNVSYSCSSGELADFVENNFDLAFVNRVITFEDVTGKEFDYEGEHLMTTAHRNFSEGFWFAATLAFHDTKKLDKVVCIDFTKQGVEKFIADLINRINEGWLPSEDEIESPIYDR